MAEVKDLKALYDRYKTASGARWICGYDDFLNVFSYIRAFKVKNVLELGTGIGAMTAAMGYALPEDGRINTVEAYEKCMNQASLLLPAELKERVTLHVREPYPKLHQELGDFHFFSNFENEDGWLTSMAKECDLLVIDGPGPFLHDGKVVDLPNGDIFSLLAFLKKGTLIYVDGRKKMLDLLRRHYAHCVNYITFDEKHTLLGRTESPAIPRDYLEESLRREGYFS